MLDAEWLHPWQKHFPPPEGVKNDTLCFSDMVPILAKSVDLERLDQERRLSCTAAKD